MIKNRIYVATILLHKNLSSEDRVRAIENQNPLIVTITDDFSDFAGKTVEINLLDYLLIEDTKSVEALIAVNNIADYELNKDNVLVKVIEEDGNFKLSAGQISSPYVPSTPVEGHFVRLSFKVLNNDINNPITILKYKVSINDAIDPSIVSELQEKGVTITGEVWNEFSVAGTSIMYIESADKNTSFYGNQINGFQLK